MARSSCTSCGLRSQHCQCRPEDSTAANVDDAERAIKRTRTSFCVTYLVIVLGLLLFGSLLEFLVGLPLHLKESTCYLEVFVDSFSVSTVSTAPLNATADWNVSFVAKSPGNGCKASLHIIKSRLFRGGDKLISESRTPDYFGQLVAGKIDEPLSYSVFKTVATPQYGVVWDLRVNVVSSITVSDRYDRSFMILNCGDIPVNFTADAAGNMKGSLLGYMRPCEYLFRNDYSDIFL